MTKFVRLALVLAAVLSSACASRGGPGGPVPRPFPTPGSEEPATPPVNERQPGVAPVTIDGYAIAGTALALRGAPYRNGGSDPSGFDCSGFVWFVFAQHGIAMPRTVADQSRSGEPVSAGVLGPGDLVFFNTKGSGPTHVGIAIGGDAFVHAPTANGQVRVERIGSAYWSSRFVDARRITPRDAVPCASTAGRSCQ